MTAEGFDSSDAARSARPLKHVRTVTFDGPIALELGGSLPSVTVAFESYGQLNADASNAVLVCHALSGDSHVARHDEDDDPGWWDVAVGPGKPIDTERYFVVCPNVLGGCRGTTGPESIDPATGRPYGSDFPTITIGDMVDVQRRLFDHLGVARLLAAIGGSMGGHQTLQWATTHPDRVAGVVALATSPRLSSQALAFDVVGRNAILRDPQFADGQYYDGEGPAVGLAIARMLGHITYLSAEALDDRFDADRMQPKDVATSFERRFSVGSYLAYQGDRFVERFDANSYITLSLAIDLFDLGGTPEELAEALARSTCRWLVASFSSDWLYTPSQAREIVAALASRGKPVSYVDVTSSAGHDGFLLADDLEIYGGLVTGFLENLADPEAGAALDEVAADYADAAPTNVFEHHRIDYDRIVDLVPAGSSVLDLGCGPGTLMRRLKAAGAGSVAGVELDERAVVEAVRRGLDVVEFDLNGGLGLFGDEEFDVVVLSHTLQAVTDVQGLVSEMLRVGRRSIVSFPNFGYHKLRRMLAEDGRSPEAPGLLHFHWYDTPNRRFFSITDFQEFCDERGITVHQSIALDTEEGLEVTDDANLNADMAIFVISR
jgi:homoserine O-acetyltransferase/O-succinyltransferase